MFDRINALPPLLRKKWKSKRASESLLLFMKYWKISSTEHLFSIPIPRYLQMQDFMEKDLKEQSKIAKKQKREAAKKGKRGKKGRG